MESQEYHNIYKHETSHFYYVTTHALVLSLIKRYNPQLLTTKKLSILDAGCGTGGLAKQLEKLGKVWGIDFHPLAVAYSRRRGVRVKQALTGHLPFKDKTFDVVTCIDVLYHQKVDDLASLREFRRVLKPGGILIIRVPANPWLRLKHDTLVHTRLRYTKSELQDKLRRAGFQILKLSYVNAWLLPFAIGRHFWEKLLSAEKPKSNIQTLPFFVNRWLTFISQIETWLFTKIGLPWGIGLLVVSRRPGDFTLTTGW